MSSFPTARDVMSSPTGAEFRKVEELLALRPETIAKWVKANARHSVSTGLRYAHGVGFVTLGAGRRVWALFPDRYIVKTDTVTDIIVITHPSLNGMEPHHFYKGLATSLVTDTPVFMIPASTRTSPWGLPKPVGNDYLAFAGRQLLEFLLRSIARQEGIDFSEKPRLHLHGWSQGGALSLAIAGAIQQEFEVASLIVGGLPNVLERGRREIFRDISSISFMDYVRTGKLSGYTYNALHCPAGKLSLLAMLGMNAKLLGDIVTTLSDNLPLHEAFRHASLMWQLEGLTVEAAEKTVIVSALNDPVSPEGSVNSQIELSGVPVRQLRVEGTHTFGDVIPWSLFAANKLGLDI